MSSPQTIKIDDVEYVRTDTSPPLGNDIAFDRPPKV